MALFLSTEQDLAGISRHCSLGTTGEMVASIHGEDGWAKTSCCAYRAASQHMCPSVCPPTALQDHGTWNHETMGLWDHGTVGPWNHRTSPS